MSSDYAGFPIKPDPASFARVYGMKDYSWQTSDCACFGMDPNLFIHSSEDGSRNGHQATLAAREAKKVCQRCPVKVRQACLEFALTEPQERFGIYGGLDPTERRQVAAQRAARKRGAA